MLWKRTCASTMSKPKNLFLKGINEYTSCEEEPSEKEEGEKMREYIL